MLDAGDLRRGGKAQAIFVGLHLGQQRLELFLPARRWPEGPHWRSFGIGFPGKAVEDLARCEIFRSFQIARPFGGKTCRPDMLAGIEVSLVVGTGAGVIQEIVYNVNLDIIFHRSLNHGFYG